MPGLRLLGEIHLTVRVKLASSGARFGCSFSNLITNLRVLAAFTRSSSGPRAATLFASPRPTRPLTREVVNQFAARALQRVSALWVNQISKLLLGKIRSSPSIVSNPAK